jgi:hypothetical protein
LAGLLRRTLPARFAAVFLTFGLRAVAVFFFAILRIVFLSFSLGFSQMFRFCPNESYSLEAAKL